MRLRRSCWISAACWSSGTEIMSLFDTLRCDYPLPDPEFQKAEFHTKDLGCALSRYRIDRQGRLWVNRFQVRIFPRDKPSRKPPPPEDTHFHGEFCFYGPYSNNKQVEYRARFTRGDLEWIRRVEQKAPPFRDSLTWLGRDGRYLEQERPKQLERLLQRLEKLDPEVAKRTVKAFKSRPIAASWLTERCSSSGLSPVEVLAQGKRKTVLKVIAEIHEFCW